MEVVERLRPGRIGVWSAALAAALLIASLALAGAARADDEALMSISASGDSVSCSDDVCTVDPGDTFTITVSADDIPDGGYVLIQSFIDYGANLTYNPTEDRAEELLWPDIGSEEVLVRAEIGPGLVNHGGLTGLIPPLPLSEYAGPVFEMSFTCTANVTTNDIRLLPAHDPVALTNGALFTIEDGVEVIPKVNALTINCGEPPEEPGDGDSNGDQPVDGLPPTGAGIGQPTGGADTTLWIAIAALVATGIAGLGMSGWRVARARREK